MGNKYKELGGKYTNILKAVAYINFICSIIIALIVWIKFGTIKTGYFNSELNPIGIALGAEIILCGFITFVLLLTICAISENTISLRIDMNKLLKSNDVKLSSNNESSKNINDYSDNELEKLEELKYETNGKAICFAEDLGDKWLCFCGTKNDKKNKNCTNCGYNQKFTLSQYTKQNFRI